MRINTFCAGIVGNSKVQTLEMKKRTATIIVEKLCESSILCILVSKHESLLVGAITGTNTLRMQYDRFDDLITHKYGIVVKNWPLNRFCNPSAVATRIELELLLNSWESGATRFQQLSKDEMRAWENERFSSKLTMMSLSPPSTPTSVPPLPTAPLAPPAPNLIPPVPSVAIPPEPAPPTPIQPGAVLVPNPEMVADIIRLDPSLQSIDPALIMAGIMQGHHSSTIASPVADSNSSPTSAPPTLRKKRDRGAFEIVTPGSFNLNGTKKSRKNRKGEQTRKSTPATGRENIPLVEGTQ